MSDFADERTLVAEACRVLADRRLAPGFLGHVSLRVDDDRVLVRCRGPRERGLATRLSLTVVAAGGELRDLPAEDLAELPDLGGTLNTTTAWRHELARLA